MINNKFNFEVNRAFLNTFNDNEIELSSEKIILSQNDKISLTNNNFKFKSAKDFSYLAKLDTSFKNLMFFLNRIEFLNLQELPLDGLDGNIDASITLMSKKLSNGSLNYEVAGKLGNLNFIKIKKNFNSARKL